MITWIVLTAVAGEVILRGLSEFIAFASEQLAIYLPDGAQSLVMFGVSPLVLSKLLLAWFQPFLLKLNATRGFAWIALWIIPSTIVILLLPTVGMTLPIVFMQAALPGVTLIGWRSRFWMTVPAAALYAAAAWLLFAPKFGNLNLVIASSAYGATLLYGTHLLPMHRSQSMSD
jgi:hypothetical protein